MRLPLAAARKHALTMCMHLLTIMQYIHVLFFKSKLQHVSLTKMLCTWLRVLS